MNQEVLDTLERAAKGLAGLATMLETAGLSGAILARSLRIECLRCAGVPWCKACMDYHNIGTDCTRPTPRMGDK